jgi:reductive dehalogenase
MGRTVRIVGPVANISPNDNPHSKVRRGEMGKALFNWMHNTISTEPIIRTTNQIVAADPTNVLNLHRLPKGKINPTKTAVPDRAVMTRHIKLVAKTLGLDVVAVGRSHPNFMYDGTTTSVGEAGDKPPDTPEDLVRQHPFFICGGAAWDYGLIKAHRHFIGDAAYEFAAERATVAWTALERYIQELGYKTLRGGMNAQAGAVAAGVGELGRNALIITPEYGARVHINDSIMTDLPLEPEGPIDIGVNEFCAVCRKCATTCPTNSISFEDRVVHNGVEKFKINWETCYKLRPFVEWNICLTCAVICPYTKPLKWWHRLAVGSLRTTPIRLRPPLVAFLKWLDDRFWGVVPRRRVQALGYDTGIKPGERGCTIPGCTADHEDRAVIQVSDIGYYTPLKENTNRFTKQAARAK